MQPWLRSPNLHVGSPRADGAFLRRSQIRKDKTVAFDDFSRTDRNRLREHGTIMHERVKLAALAAGISRSREHVEEVVII